MPTRPSIAFVLLVLSAGCSGASGPTALFEVTATPAQQDLKRTPWPNDLLRDGDGRVALSKLPSSDTDLTPHVLRDLHEVQDGFGVISGAYFPVSAAIDPASLAGNVHLYDLESGAELPVWTHFRAKDLPPAIYARPVNGGALLERHRYAYVVTRKVKGPSGALAPSSELQTLLAARAAPAGNLGRAYPIYQPLLARLDAGPVGRNDVAAATVFTTHSITAPLVAMRAALSAGLPPKATVTMIFAKTRLGTNAGTLDELLGTPVAQLPGSDNPGGIAHDKIAFVVQGTFESPDYLNAGTTLTAAGGSGASIDVFSGPPEAPTPKGTAVVPFTLVLPELASYVNVPVVMFQHGLGSDRSAVMAVANTFAGAGMATLGIDIPFHGSRDVVARDNVHNFGGAQGPDGWPETDGGQFLKFFNALGNSSRQIPSFMPGALRAAFMQSAHDTMQAARLVTAGDVSAIGAAEPRLTALSLRRDALAYAGESFGSIIGGITIAIEPTIGAAVPDVGGGGLLFPLLLQSHDYGPKLAPFLDGALGTQTADEADPPDTDFAYNIAQYLVEQSDPSAYAAHVILQPLVGNAPKHVLQPSARFDEAVPNDANVNLARAMGLQPVDLPSGGKVDLGSWPSPPATLSAPVQGNVTVDGVPVTAAFIQFEEASHGMISNQRGQRTADLRGTYPFPKITPVPIANPIARLHAITVRFLADYFAGAVPSVVSGL